MHLDTSLALVGALVGLLVGLTGMGGGALLTPLLVLVFHVPPLAAVSSDLVTSLVMKPIGAAVHLRRRSVQTGLVRWLALGSVPSAFAGSVLIGTLGRSRAVQHDLTVAIGVLLLISLSSTVVRQVIDRRAGNRGAATPLVVKPLRTVLIGVAGGLAVGLTSVGAGSLVIALLLISYPTLRPSQLVGTDIVQAIPLVGAAAVGHLLFGDVRLAVTGSLLVGALPAIYLGARLSSSAPAKLTRPAVAGVLLASALGLLQAPAWALLVGACGAVAVMAALGGSSTKPAPHDEPSESPGVITVAYRDGQPRTRGALMAAPHLDSLLAALSEPRHAQMVRLLEHRQLTQRDFTEQLQMTQPLVSFHLRVLTEAGLVESTICDRIKVYRLNAGTLSLVAQRLTTMAEHATRTAQSPAC